VNVRNYLSKQKAIELLDRKIRVVVFSRYAFERSKKAVELLQRENVKIIVRNGTGRMSLLEKQILSLF